MGFLLHFVTPRGVFIFPLRRNISEPSCAADGRKERRNMVLRISPRVRAGADEWELL